MFSALKLELLNGLTHSMPPHLLPIKQEVEQWVHNYISSWLSAHDFVTREEFELYVKQMQRLRTKLQQLQNQLVSLDPEHAPK